MYCYRLVFDGWLEVTIPDSEAAEQLISSVLQLRAAWNTLIELKLKGTAQYCTYLLSAVL